MVAYTAFNSPSECRRIATNTACAALILCVPLMPFTANATSSGGMAALNRLKAIVKDTTYEEGNHKTCVDKIPVTNTCTGWKDDRYWSEKYDISINETKGSDEASVGNFLISFTCYHRRTFSGTSHGTEKNSNPSSNITGKYQFVFGELATSNIKVSSNGSCGSSVKKLLTK